ncbi:MAG: molybdate ABC transporter substrate-binding protein [Proteobacteria bacterium]|nr:molybdate ABC transporter substrate-binding protein [Pseudomonadota bacterium]MDA0926592.1 molybdate ABC transporter substrate-binding protein [Pseudomonadota bacterium]
MRFHAAFRIARLGVALQLLILPLLTSQSRAEEILVAVASNFAEPMAQIIAEFEAGTGHRIEMAIGSSGRFYAQIVNGAPFQIFFSADQDKVAQLAVNGLIVPDTEFTYAVGRLVLWSAAENSDLVDLDRLADSSFQRLAIANPRVAPYGAAAVEVLQSVGISPLNDQRIVQGENIAQAFQFVDTGNAELGLVALSQVYRDGRLVKGSSQIVSQDLHQPIRQDAVLLARAAECGACRQFLDFVASETGQRIMQSFGYSQYQE